jgi:hypothetical protein
VGALKLYKRENNTSVKGALGLYVGFKKGCAGAYRYGFNGQEKVDEISGIGNHNTALFWEYDTRLGRRWNVDPVDQMSISNYACFRNNPVIFVDVNGDKAFFAFEGENKESDRLNLQAKINKGLDGFFTAIIDAKTGELLISKVEAKDIENATAEVQAFINVIKNAVESKTDINIGIVSNSIDVSVGDYEFSKIDIADLDAIDNMKNNTGLPNVATSQSKLGHEISEQQEKQEKGFKGKEGFINSHKKTGLKNENKIIGNNVKRDAKGDGVDIVTGSNSQTFIINNKQKVKLYMQERPATDDKPAKTSVVQKKVD